MVLRYWDPFTDVRRMQESMNSFWRGNHPQVANHHQVEEPETVRWPLPLDVSDEGDNFLVEASLPGVMPEDIEVAIEGNLLSIKGDCKVEREHKRGEHIIRERRTGAFHRSLRLPSTVDTDRAAPHYQNGVLTITLPKVETRKARQLKVTTGNTPDDGAA